MANAEEPEANAAEAQEAAEQTAELPALAISPTSEEALTEPAEASATDEAAAPSSDVMPSAAMQTMEVPALTVADDSAAAQTMEVPALLPEVEAEIDPGSGDEVADEAAAEVGVEEEIEAEVEIEADAVVAEVEEPAAAPAPMPVATAAEESSGEVSVERIALRNLLDRPSLARLWEETRKKLEQRGGVGGTVRLLNATDAERVAIANLLGLRSLPEGTVSVRLDLLDRTLADSRFEIGLEAAMALLGGPLRNVPAERAAADARRAAMWQEAREHPVVLARPSLGRWLDELEGDGLLKRLADGDEAALLANALEVLTVLPAANLGLPAFANQVLGTSHGLDSSKPLSTLVLRALSVLADRPPPSSAAERRDLWAWAGVICDDLTCDVLVLGLAPEGEGLIPDWLRTFAAAGEPVRLTLRQVTRTYIALPAGSRVHVCENPAVVAAAADRLGAATTPLICVGGFLNTAARTLLWSLAQSGATVAYHGDFDWPGLQIANNIHQLVAFEPWRYEAADYLRAIRDGADSLQLAGKPATAAWDAALAEVMTGKGLAVEEEAVLELLLTDLDSGNG